MAGLRAFLAIDPDPAARRAAAVLAQQLAGELPRVRWVRPEGYHVTLRFLGQVDPAALPPLVTAVRAAVARLAPFELRLGAVGFFPSPRRPRVVALALAPEAPLLALAARVEGAVRSLGFPAEGRPFHAHLTLGRPQGGGPRPPLEGGGAEALARFAVREVVLFRSELRPEGSRYTPLERLPLGGSVSPASTTSEGEDHGPK